MDWAEMWECCFKVTTLIHSKNKNKKPKTKNHFHKFSTDAFKTKIWWTSISLDLLFHNFYEYWYSGTGSVLWILYDCPKEASKLLSLVELYTLCNFWQNSFHWCFRSLYFCYLFRATYKSHIKLFSHKPLIAPLTRWYMIFSRKSSLL